VTAKIFTIEEAIERHLEGWRDAGLAVPERVSRGELVAVVESK
jgi:predicted DNA-binding protein